MSAGNKADMGTVVLFFTHLMCAYNISRNIDETGTIRQDAIPATLA